jgi:hypothetical protein
MSVNDLMPGHELDIMVARIPALDVRYLPSDFAPSKDIAHAWRLAEQFRLMVFPRGKGWACARTYASGGEGPSCGEHWIDDSLDVYAEAPTAPLAICRAALLAAGFEDGLDWAADRRGEHDDA